MVFTIRSGINAIAGALGVVLATMASPTVLAAAPGDLDPTFGTGGRVVTRFGGDPQSRPVADAVAVQPDGKIVAVGTANTVDPFDGQGVEVAALVRYNPNGALDPTFGSGGVKLTPLDFIRQGPQGEFIHWSGSAVVVQPDGKIVVAGAGRSFPASLELGKNTGVVLARYTANGSLDPSFANFDTFAFFQHGVVSGRPGTLAAVTSCHEVERVAALARQPNGKLVVLATCFGGVLTVARLNPDGTPDLGFGQFGGFDRLLDFQAFNVLTGALAIQSDGAIIVAARSFLGNFSLLRIHATGQSEFFSTQVGLVSPPFLPFDGVVAAMVQPDDGKIVAAGTALVDASTGGFALARFNPDGALDSSFGSGGTVTTSFGGQAFAAALHPEGKIIVAGQDVGFSLARFNRDGSLDTSFGVAGKVLTDFTPVLPAQPGQIVTSLAKALVIQGDGKIVAAGSARVNDTGGSATATFFALARYIGENTPTGGAVEVKLGRVTLTFENVTTAGITTVDQLDVPAPPSEFKATSIFFDATTTAQFTGSIKVCVDYTGLAVGNEDALRLFHFEGSGWVQIGSMPDTASDVICGVVVSLSPFAIFERVANQAPVANAGPDQTVRPGRRVTLDGSASVDPDNGPSPLSFRWTQAAGRPAKLVGAMTAAPTFKPRGPGIYIFNLVVHDGDAASAPDHVQVTVAPSRDGDHDGGDERDTEDDHDGR